MWGKGLCVSIWFSQRHSLMNLSCPHCLRQFQRRSILILWSTCLFYEGTILFWPPWLCNVSWIQEFWSLQLVFVLSTAVTVPSLLWFSLNFRILFSPWKECSWERSVVAPACVWACGILMKEDQDHAGWQQRVPSWPRIESETLSQNQAKTKVQMLLKFLELYGIDRSPSLVWTFNQY